MTDTDITAEELRELASRVESIMPAFVENNDVPAKAAAALRAYAAIKSAQQGWQPINIIFDGPPSHISGRFIEVELDDGRSIRVGKWIERSDGLWKLRITELPKGPQS